MPVYIENRLYIFDEKKTNSIQEDLVCLQRHGSLPLKKKGVFSCFHVPVNIPAPGSQRSDLIKQSAEEGKRSPAEFSEQFHARQRGIVTRAARFGSFLRASSGASNSWPWAREVCSRS